LRSTNRAHAEQVLRMATNRDRAPYFFGAMLSVVPNGFTKPPLMLEPYVPFGHAFKYAVPPMPSGAMICFGEFDGVSVKSTRSPMRPPLAVAIVERPTTLPVDDKRYTSSVPHKAPS
jgi:hypothetical protein